MKDNNTFLLNFSNHPFDKWLPKQKEMAMKRWGRVENLDFPHIPPGANEEELDKLVEKYVQKIIKKAPTAVHLMGEMTFVYRMVKRLQELGISCVASTTNRKVEFLPDGTKKSVFEFVSFRKYSNMNTNSTSKKISENFRFKFNKILKGKTKGFNIVLWTFAILALLSSLYSFWPDCPFLGWFVMEGFWSSWMDPVFSITTGVLAFLLFILETYHHWKDSLEKRLTVEYMYNDKVVMKIEEAYLAGESDIRQWAQQLGKQLCGRDLSFDLYLDKDEKSSGLYPDDKNSYYNLYVVRMFLYEDPRHEFTYDTIDSLKEAREKEENKREKKKYKLKAETLAKSICIRPEENKIWTWKRKYE